MRKTLALVALLAGCHRGSPIVQADLAAPEAPPDMTTPPPPMPVLTLDGKKTDFKAYRKRVTLVAFWGTFCEPCIKELPMLEALYQRTKGDTDLSIVAVSMDEVNSDADRKHIADVATGLKLTFPIVIDAQGAVSERYMTKDGATAPDGGVDMQLPTMVTLLANGHYARRSGFPMDISPESFVSEGMATIARAEAGTLPEDDYQPPQLPDLAAPLAKKPVKAKK